MENTPRKPWLAGLLTLLAIGLGHIYAGAPKKGILLFVGGETFGLLLLAFILFTRSAIDFLFFAVCILAAIIIFLYLIYCCLDAIDVAKKNKDTYQLRNYNKWYIYLAYWFVCSFLAAPITNFPLERTIKESTGAYKIAGNSMNPTLLLGDHILIDKLVYKNNEPHRGDIIIFLYPKDPSKDFVDRVIGLEDDIVEIRDKQLYINHEPYNESYIINKDPGIISASQNSRDFFGPITVPKNAVFVMGDNRDHASDSRFWGLVDKITVKGKVKSLYWSWDSENSKVRWTRIGKTIDQVTN